MLILITYDVSTETAQGRKRLTKVAEKCESFGQRVQNSVFECQLDWEQYVKLQNELKQIIDENEDSLRFYNLGLKYDTKIIQIGRKPLYPIDGSLII
jgi:CRISPR-associated protein Cas2